MMDNNMKMKNLMLGKNIELDGTNSGFSAMYVGDNKLIKFTNNLTRFRNLDLLIAEIEKAGTVNYMLGITDNNLFIPWKCITPTDDGRYMYFSDSGKIINIAKKNKKEKVIFTGYFLFGDEPKVKMSDFEEGKQINKKYYTFLKDAFSREIRSNRIKDCSVDENEFLTYSFRTTTAKIRISKNNNLVVVNQKRKEEGKKVLPFDKDLDKFKTIYFCATKEINDTTDEKIIREILEDFLDKILDDIGDEEEVKNGITTGIIYNNFRHFIVV